MFPSLQIIKKLIFFTNFTRIKLFNKIVNIQIRIILNKIINNKLINSNKIFNNNNKMIINKKILLNLNQMNKSLTLKI